MERVRVWYEKGNQPSDWMMAESRIRLSDRAEVLFIEREDIATFLDGLLKQTERGTILVAGKGKVYQRDGKVFYQNSDGYSFEGVEMARYYLHEYHMDMARESALTLETYLHIMNKQVKAMEAVEA